MNPPANDLRAIRIIWASLLFSIVIYAAIIFMTVPKPAMLSFNDAFSNPIVLALQVAGVGMFFLAFIMSSVLLRRAPATPPATPMPPGAVTVTPRARLVLIVRWAMIESAAIFGLLAAFLANDARVFLPLGALAVGGMLMSYPSDTRLSAMTNP